MKWLRFILLNFFIVTSLVGFAAQAQPLDCINLEYDLSFFVDEDFRYTPQTVDQKPFKKSSFSNLNLGFFYGQLWCKFDIKGKLPEDPILQYDNPTIDFIELFIFKNGRWQSLGYVGDMIPFKERKIKSRFPRFEIKETGNYLMRIRSNGEPFMTELTLFSQEKLRDRSYKRNLLAGVFLGLFLVTLIFNVFMYFMMKGRKNLILIFYIFSMLIYNMGMSGYGFQFVWPSAVNFQNHVLHVFGSILSLIHI